MLQPGVNHRDISDSVIGPAIIPRRGIILQTGVNHRGEEPNQGDFCGQCTKREKESAQRDNRTFY